MRLFLFPFAASILVVSSALAQIDYVPRPTQPNPSDYVPVRRAGPPPRKELQVATPRPVATPRVTPTREVRAALPVPSVQMAMRVPVEVRRALPVPVETRPITERPRSTKAADRDKETRHVRAPSDDGQFDAEALADPNNHDPLHIVISLSEQTATLYKGERVVSVSRVSTGKPGYETDTGEYAVRDKDLHHKSNLYGKHGRISRREDGSPMPYYLRLSDDGTGIHGGVVPDHPASHGCIRMPTQMAAQWFKAVPIGTPATIE